MNVSRSTARLARLSLALAACFPVFTQAQSPGLREMVVHATRFAEPARSLPYGVSVVSADDIRRSGAASVNEALTRILGLPGRQDLYGGGEYRLDLRGFGTTALSNQVVVLDGVRLTEPDLVGPRLAGIPIESVERIEVLRGSGAVLYGEGATGGVILVTTRAGAGRQGPNSASLYAGAGTHSLRDLRANAHVGGGGLSLDASAHKRDSDNHRDNFRSEFDAASVTGQWSGESLRFGASLSRDDLDTGLPGALTAAQYAADPRQATTPTDWARIRNERNGLFAELDLGPWQLGFDAAARTKELRSLNFGFLNYDYDVDATDASLRARHAGTIGGMANSLVLGLDHGRWTRDILGAFGSTARQRSLGAYVRDELTLGGGTRLSAGWRSERLRKSDSASASRLADRLHAWELGVSQPVTTDVTAYARVGSSFRLANVDEFSFTLPSAQLRPQTSDDVELGLRWARAGSSVEARLYQHRLQDEIGFDPAAFRPLAGGANVNLDPTRRTGLELDASHAVSSQLTLRMNAALRRATFRSGPYAGNDVPLAPRRTLALRADWTPAARHRVTGGVNWVSSQHPDFANACSMPSYATADLRYAYEWRNAEFSLGATNLFDRKHFTQAFACAAGQPTSIYPEPGRAVTAAVRVSF